MVLSRQRKSSWPVRAIVLGLIVSFIGTTVVVPGPGYAQPVPTVLNLPVPGTMVAPSPAFVPTILKGIKVDPQNPFKFDFVVDAGHADLEGEALKQESRKLIKYFLASLTTPEDDIWVNLSPYEKKRVIPDEFGSTEMGRDLLAQDYLLKQFTAALVYPEGELGRTFWNRVRKKAHEKYGVTDVPMDTFNKVWIVPDRAVIYQNGDTAFIKEAHLKVMMEEDYVAFTASGAKVQGPRFKGHDENALGTGGEALGTLSSELIRQLILPEIEKEINEGAHFARLRQIYHSLLLAVWFKDNLKKSLLGQVYVDQNKVKGVDVQDKTVNGKIYQQYLKAYKKGVYDYIKEDYDSVSREKVPRKYFSGGFVFRRSDLAMVSDPEQPTEDTDPGGMFAVEVEVDPGSGPDSPVPGSGAVWLQEKILNATNGQEIQTNDGEKFNLVSEALPVGSADENMDLGLVMFLENTKDGRSDPIMRVTIKDDLNIYGEWLDLSDVSFRDSGRTVNLKHKGLSRRIYHLYSQSLPVGTKVHAFIANETTVTYILRNYVTGPDGSVKRKRDGKFVVEKSEVECAADEISIEAFFARIPYGHFMQRSMGLKIIELRIGSHRGIAALRELIESPDHVVRVEITKVKFLEKSPAGSDVAMATAGMEHFDSSFYGVAKFLSRAEAATLSLEIAKHLKFDLEKKDLLFEGEDVAMGISLQGEEIIFFRIENLFFMSLSDYKKLSVRLKKEIGSNVVVLRDIPQSDLIKENHLMYTIQMILYMKRFDFSQYETVIDGGAGDGILSLVAYRLGAPFLDLFEYKKEKLDDAIESLERIYGLARGRHFQAHRGDIRDEEFLEREAERINRRIIGAQSKSAQVAVLSNIGNWRIYRATNQDSMRIIKYISRISLFIAGGYQYSRRILHENRRWVRQDQEMIRDQFGFAFFLPDVSAKFGVIPVWSAKRDVENTELDEFDADPAMAGGLESKHAAITSLWDANKGDRISLLDPRTGERRIFTVLSFTRHSFSGRSIIVEDEDQLGSEFVLKVESELTPKWSAEIEAAQKIRGPHLVEYGVLVEDDTNRQVLISQRWSPPKFWRGVELNVQGNDALGVNDFVRQIKDRITGEQRLLTRLLYEGLKAFQEVFEAGFFPGGDFFDPHNLWVSEQEGRLTVKAGDFGEFKPRKDGDPLSFLPAADLRAFLSNMARGLEAQGVNSRYNIMLQKVREIIRLPDEEVLTGVQELITLLKDMMREEDKGEPADPAMAARPSPSDFGGAGEARTSSSVLGTSSGGEAGSTDGEGREDAAMGGRKQAPVVSPQSPAEDDPMMEGESSLLPGLEGSIRVEGSYEDLNSSVLAVDFVLDRNFLELLQALDIDPQELVSDALTRAVVSSELGFDRERAERFFDKNTGANNIPVLFTRLKSEDLRDLSSGLVRRILFEEVWKALDYKNPAGEKLFQVSVSPGTLDLREYYEEELSSDDLLQLTMLPLVSDYDFPLGLSIKKRGSFIQQQMTAFEEFVAANEKRMDLDSRLRAHVIIDDYKHRIFVREFPSLKILALKQRLRKRDALRRQYYEGGVSQSRRDKLRAQIEAVDPNLRAMPLQSQTSHAAERELSPDTLLDELLSAAVLGDRASAERLLDLLLKADQADAFHWNIALGVLPKIKTDFNELLMLTHMLTRRYRELLVDGILAARFLNSRQRDHLKSAYLRMFLDSSEDRLASVKDRMPDGLSEAAILEIDRDFVRLKERFHDLNIQLNYALQEAIPDNRKVTLEEFDVGQKDRYLDVRLPDALTASEEPEAQLAQARAYFAAVYGVELDVPFEEVTPEDQIPTTVGSKAKLYSRNDIPSILKVLADIDLALARLPRHVVLNSPSLQKLQVVKAGRPHASVAENKIMIVGGGSSYSNWWVDNSVYHELGHTFNHDGRFLIYVDPQRIREIIRKNAAFIGYRRLLTSRVPLDFSTFLWDIFTRLYKKRLREYKQKYKSGRGVDLSSYSRIVWNDFPISYVFNEENPQPFTKYRKTPVEFIPAIVSLGARSAKKLEALDSIAVDLFKAVVGEVKDRAMAGDTRTSSGGLGTSSGGEAGSAKGEGRDDDLAMVGIPGSKGLESDEGDRAKNPEIVRADRPRIVPMNKFKKKILLRQLAKKIGKDEKKALQINTKSAEDLIREVPGSPVRTYIIADQLYSLLPGADSFALASFGGQSSRLAHLEFAALIGVPGAGDLLRIYTEGESNLFRVSLVLNKLDMEEFISPDYGGGPKSNLRNRTGGEIVLKAWLEEITHILLNRLAIEDKKIWIEIVDVIWDRYSEPKLAEVFVEPHERNNKFILAHEVLTEVVSITRTLGQAKAILEDIFSDNKYVQTVQKIFEEAVSLITLEDAIALAGIAEPIKEHVSTPDYYSVIDDIFSEALRSREISVKDFIDLLYGHESEKDKSTDHEVGDFAMLNEVLSLLEGILTYEDLIAIYGTENLLERRVISIYSAIEILERSIDIPDFKLPDTSRRAIFMTYLKNRRRSVNAENIVSRPMRDNSIDQDKLQEWILAQPAEFKDTARYLAENITYIDQAQFEIALEESIESFQEDIAERPFVVVLVRGNNEEKKSGDWVYELAREKGMREPVKVISVEEFSDGGEIKGFIEKRGVRDFVMIDDASYSGSQINRLKGVLYHSNKRGNISEEIKVHFMIPYATKSGQAAALHKVGDEEIKLHNSRQIDLLVDIFDVTSIHKLDRGDPKHNQLRMIMEKYRGSPSYYEEEALTYFQHGMPDALSVLSAVLIGYVSSDKSIPFIPEIAKPYEGDSAMAARQNSSNSDGEGREDLAMAVDRVIVELREVGEKWISRRYAADQGRVFKNNKDLVNKFKLIPIHGQVLIDRQSRHGILILADRGVGKSLLSKEILPRFPWCQIVAESHVFLSLRGGHIYAGLNPRYTVKYIEYRRKGEDQKTQLQIPAEQVSSDFVLVDRLITISLDDREKVSVKAGVKQSSEIIRLLAKDSRRESFYGTDPYGLLSSENFNDVVSVDIKLPSDLDKRLVELERIIAAIMVDGDFVMTGGDDSSMLTRRGEGDGVSDEEGNDGAMAARPNPSDLGEVAPNLAKDEIGGGDDERPSAQGDGHDDDTAMAGDTRTSSGGLGTSSGDKAGSAKGEGRDGDEAIAGGFDRDAEAGDRDLLEVIRHANQIYAEESGKDERSVFETFTGRYGGKYKYIHADLVDYQGHGILFVGLSGTGKSTLAKAMVNPRSVGLVIDLSGVSWDDFDGEIDPPVYKNRFAGTEFNGTDRIHAIRVGNRLIAGPGGLSKARNPKFIPVSTIVLLADNRGALEDSFTIYDSFHQAMDNNDNARSVMEKLGGDLRFEHILGAMLPEMPSSAALQRVLNQLHTQITDHLAIDPAIADSSGDRNLPKRPWLDDTLFRRLSRAVFDDSGMNVLIDAVVKDGGVAPNDVQGQVLVVGFGRNYKNLVIVAERFPKANIVGVEWDEFAVEEVKKELLQSHPDIGARIQLHTADARDLREFVPSGSIRLVLKRSVLSLYDVPGEMERDSLKEILEEVNRVLEPGGIISGGFGVLENSVSFLEQLGLENLRPEDDMPPTVLFRKSLSEMDIPAAADNALASNPGGIALKTDAMDFQVEGEGVKFDLSKFDLACLDLEGEDDGGFQGGTQSPSCDPALKAQFEQFKASFDGFTNIRIVKVTALPIEELPEFLNAKASPSRIPDNPAPSDERNWSLSQAVTREDFH